MTEKSHILTLFGRTVIHCIHTSFVLTKRNDFLWICWCCLAKNLGFFGHPIFEIPLWPKRRCYFRMNLNPLRKVKAQACSHGLMTSLFRLDLTAWYPTPAWNNGPKADFQLRFFLVFIPCVLCLQSSVAFYFFCVNKWDSQMTYLIMYFSKL